MALLLDEYVSKCGIDLLLHTMGSEPIVEEDSVLKGIYIQNKSGSAGGSGRRGHRLHGGRRYRGTLRRAL